jgi:thiol-disulfide isomerase/thioredoxin
MKLRATLLLVIGGLALGLAGVVAHSLVTHTPPPPRLLHVLQSSRAGSALAQRWIRAALPGPHPAPRLQRGQTVPDLALPDLQGRMHHLAEWRGQRVLLNFWAPWCTPCRREMPALVAAQKRYGGDRVQIVGIAVDRPAAVRAYLRKVPVNYPVLIAADPSRDPGPSFGNSLGALPYSVLIEPDGRVADTHYGALQPAQLRWWLAP